MKTASILYLPPPAIAGKTNYGDPLAFIENLKRFRRDHPLVFYSERTDYGPLVKGLGEFYRIHDPALVKNHPGSEKNRFSVANFIFFAGLCIANKLGLSHILYLEADCRVGADGWDKTIFDEHFAAEAKRDLPLLFSGTIVCHNPCNMNLEAAKRWANFCEKENKKKPLVPVATYGNKGAADRGNPIVFPNGALSLLSLEAMNSFWDLKRSISELSVGASPFDVEIGIQAWAQCGASIYDRVLNLQAHYSGFGEVMTTESQRFNWLKQKRIVAVHQIKGNQQLE